MGVLNSGRLWIWTSFQVNIVAQLVLDAVEAMISLLFLLTHSPVTLSLVVTSCCRTMLSSSSMSLLLSPHTMLLSFQGQTLTKLLPSSPIFFSCKTLPFLMSHTTTKPLLYPAMTLFSQTLRDWVGMLMNLWNSVTTVFLHDRSCPQMDCGDPLKSIMSFQEREWMGTLLSGAPLKVFFSFCRLWKEHRDLTESSLKTSQICMLE